MSPRRLTTGTKASVRSRERKLKSPKSSASAPLKRQEKGSSPPANAVLATAKRVLQIESEAIAGLIDRLDERFESAVDLLRGCQGRVVVTGLGKSGLIGRKVAATFASTGSPSFFLHAAEALHGDLGMLTADDILLAISTSGETEELIG